PWKYLGWKIFDSHIEPQTVHMRHDVRTLNDLQKVLGAINWMRTLLGIISDDLQPF
ncbi:POK6 protein, partial [Piaya cayana]|nr:POK6 protein [Piaya cayana]